MDFKELYRKYIRREGADKLLLWLAATIPELTQPNDTL